MNFYENQYYHLYNRTNNEEALFRDRENYLFFLKKFRFYPDDYVATIEYYLMLTHFHFLVRVKLVRKDVRHFQGVVHLDSEGFGHPISKAILILQSSYIKAPNKRFNRHGSLFQPHHKAKLFSEEQYYIELTFDINQNPVRTKLVEKAEEWEFSSYQDFIDLRNGTHPNKELLLNRFTINEIIELTNNQMMFKNSSEMYDPKEVSYIWKKSVENQNKGI